MADLIGDLAGIAVGQSLSQRMLHRRQVSYQQKSKLECAVRVVAGSQNGLTDKWFAGLATLAPGRLSFVGLRGGVRFLKRPPLDLTVGSVDISQPRRSSGKEAMIVDPTNTIVCLNTSSATLEWALQDPLLHWATLRLLKPIDEQSPPSSSA